MIKECHDAILKEEVKYAREEAYFRECQMKHFDQHAVSRQSVNVVDILRMSRIPMRHPLSILYVNRSFRLSTNDYNALFRECLIHLSQN